MDIEEEALKRYPKGTSFYDLTKNRVFISEGSFPIFPPEPGYKYIKVKTNEYGNLSARIFKKGEWAKTLKKTYELW